MAAGVLTILGVKMMEWRPAGYPYPPYWTFEHVGLNRLFEAMETEEKAGRPALEVGAAYSFALRTMFDGHADELWGFKHTVAHRYLPTLLPMLEDPHLVVVTRDLRANAESWVRQMRDQYGTNVPSWHAFCVMLESQRRLVENVAVSGVPQVWVKHEDVLGWPGRTARRLAEFLGVTLSASDTELVRRFIKRS